MSSTERRLQDELAYLWKRNATHGHQVADALAETRDAAARRFVGDEAGGFRAAPAPSFYSASDDILAGLREWWANQPGLTILVDALAKLEPQAARGFEDEEAEKELSPFTYVLY